MKTLRLGRECLACGARARDPGVKLRVCDRCYTAWFCSLECLERAWPEQHKPECERILAERKAAKETPNRD